jgi:hypothetical protein
MKSFLQRFGALVLGVLHGFDHLRFRGSKRLLCYPAGVLNFLWKLQVPLVDYKEHYAKETTIALCRAIETEAKQAGVYRFLNNCQESKEETALNMATERGRRQGLIAVLGCVEPCQIVQVRGNPETKKLEPRIEFGKCLHYYHYYLDPDYGLRYTRLQSWFPFTMHVGLNGRDWLARQMTKAGLAHVQKDNTFTWVQDWEAAQALLNEQLTIAWPALLDRWAEESHPWLEKLLKCPVPYYWAAQEAEYATDIAFRTAEDLARLYPRWVHQATALLQSTDVLRFMGYRLTKAGQPRQNLGGEVLTTIKELVTGTCVKHHVLQNLLKMYDKFGQLLRLENLLINVRDFKVFRRREGDADGPMEYLRLRKGVADMQRRAQLGQQINERYAAALATVEDKTPLAELAGDLGQRTTWKGRSARALNPLADEDVALLEAINRGEFMMNGFRNRDLRSLLFAHAPASTPEEAKRQSAKVTRLLRLLRAHGVITKVPKTHRYQMSAAGRSKVTALLAARQANTDHLLNAA